MIFQQPPPQMVSNPHYITEWGIRGSGGRLVIPSHVPPSTLLPVPDVLPDASNGSILLIKLGGYVQENLLESSGLLMTLRLKAIS